MGNLFEIVHNPSEYKKQLIVSLTKIIFKMERLGIILLLRKYYSRVHKQ
jgi:hypothetical protein